MSQHPTPEVLEEHAFIGDVKEFYCLDAVGCRLNALTMRTRGLPIFCPLDDWERFDVNKLHEYDFVYIDSDARVHSGTFPWTGKRP